MRPKVEPGGRRQETPDGLRRTSLLLLRAHGLPVLQSPPHTDPVSLGLSQKGEKRTYAVLALLEELLDGNLLVRRWGSRKDRQASALEALFRPARPTSSSLPQPSHQKLLTDRLPVVLDVSEDAGGGVGGVLDAVGRGGGGQGADTGEGREGSPERSGSHGGSEEGHGRGRERRLSGGVLQRAIRGGWCGRKGWSTEGRKPFVLAGQLFPTSRSLGPLVRLRAALPSSKSYARCALGSDLNFYRAPAQI